MFTLSDTGVAKIKKEMERYETKLSAIIPSLYVVQEEHGWISNEAIDYLSGLMELPKSSIQEVNSFYTMFNKQPTGKYHLQVCNNLTCSMMKSRELTDQLLSKLGVKEGELTADGLFTISRVECLGSCDTAPVLQCNFEYHENMSQDKVEKLIEDLKKKG